MLRAKLGCVTAIFRLITTIALIVLAVILIRNSITEVQYVAEDIADAARGLPDPLTRLFGSIVDTARAVSRNIRPG